MRRALSAWVNRADPQPSLRWLERECDPAGRPVRLSVESWWRCLAALAEAVRDRPIDWPEELNGHMERLFHEVLRFSRPDGGSLFRAGDPPRERRKLIVDLAERVSDPNLAGVVPSMTGGRSVPGNHAVLGSFALADRPLGVLRSALSPDGDVIGIDARDQRHGCKLALIGQGRWWLGPLWPVPPDAGRARTTAWATTRDADFIEWTFRAGKARVQRSAVLLRESGMALLSEQIDRPEPLSTMRLGLPDGVRGVAIEGSRALRLDGPQRASARVLPLGLPALPYPTERGTFAAEGAELVFRKQTEARRAWLPLLVSWDPSRNRKTVRWRELTVSERSRKCPPGTAFAVWVGWGAGDGFVFYRSLARPTLRAFLGHQTRARFFAGRFTEAGDVIPLLKVME